MHQEPVHKRSIHKASVTGDPFKGHPEQETCIPSNPLRAGSILITGANERRAPLVFATTADIDGDDWFGLRTFRLAIMTCVVLGIPALCPIYATAQHACGPHSDQLRVAVALCTLPLPLALQYYPVAAGLSCSSQHSAVVAPMSIFRLYRTPNPAFTSHKPARPARGLVPCVMSVSARLMDTRATYISS
jgi:hypothetical protein